MIKTRQVTKQGSVLKPDKPGEVVSGDDLTEYELKETNNSSSTENEYSEIVVVSNDDAFQENSEKLMTTVLETQTTMSFALHCNILLQRLPKHN